MGQPVIVVPAADAPGDDAAAAFAAGAATVTAALAAETAADAAEISTAAADAAGAAADVAVAAELDAAAAHARLDVIEDRIGDLIADMVAALDEDQADEDDGAPEVIVSVSAPEPVEPPKPPKPPKPARSKRTGFGSSAWFGGRT